MATKDIDAAAASIVTEINRGIASAQTPAAPAPEPRVTPQTAELLKKAERARRHNESGRPFGKKGAA